MATEAIREIDPWSSDEPAVALKESINTSDLTNSNGFVFEIDVETTEQFGESFSNEGFDQLEIMKHLNLDCIDAEGSSDNDENLTPFERLAQDMEEVPGTDGSVLKKVIRAGFGDPIPEGVTVRVHYNGYLEFSDEPYDSSRLRKKPLVFKLGEGEVIRGWDVGVATMKKSEFSRFLVHPDYAFRDFGCPPRIPPGATILFEIEVLGFINSKPVDEFSSLTKKEQREASLEQLLPVANAEREAGNDFFAQKLYHKAANRYLKAVRLLEPVRLKDEDDEIQWKKCILKLYLNQSLTSLKLDKFRLAIAQCHRALDIEPNNVKAHFRLGQAYMKIGEFKSSRERLIRAVRLAPGNEEIRLELLKLDKAVTRHRAIEKGMYSKMVQMVPETDHIKPKESAAKKAVREEIIKQLTIMKENPGMDKIVLPKTFTPEQIECAVEEAHTLGFKTEKMPGCGVCIYKDIYPEDAPLL